MMNNTITAKPATEKQVAFLTKLVGEKEAPEPFVEQLIASVDAGLTSRDASSAIDYLLQLPRKANAQQPEVGVYVLEDGTVVKAQQNRAKTNTYTMRWVVIGGERLVDATEDRVHGEWEYAPELKARIVGARKMTLDEAKDFILRYGQCVRCSRRLKAADSVERGIGPVCMQYFSF